MSRLLLISNRYPLDEDDPASPFVPHFARAVAALGIEVDVLTPLYSPAPWHLSNDKRESGVRVVRFESGSSSPVGSWNFLDPRSWLRLSLFLTNARIAGEQLCRNNLYDHILALWALPSGALAQSLSRRFQVQYSVWCLGSDIYSWAKRPVIRGRIARVLRGASHVFGDGEDICRRIQSWLRIPAVFLPSCRPLDAEVQEMAASVTPTDRPRFLCLGRVHPAKGVMELLETFDDLRRVLPWARLDYVGDGPLLERLRRRITSLGLDGCVTAHGAVPGRTVVEFLKRADRVVIPSHSDSLPLVFTEAVQAGRPVIGTEVGDLGEFIRRYRVGHVTPSLAKGDLALTLIQAARDPIFDPKGRHEVLALFDPARTAAQFWRQVFGKSAMVTGDSTVNPPAYLPKREYITSASAIGEWPSGKAPGC